MANSDFSPAEVLAKEATQIATPRAKVVLCGLGEGGATGSSRLSSLGFTQLVFAFLLVQTAIEFQRLQELTKDLKAWDSPFSRGCGKDFLG